MARWTRSAVLFTQGFGIGEVLEGLAQSLPEGLRQRLSANGIQGLLGRPYNGSSLKQTYEHLNVLVQEHLRTKKAREISFPEAVTRLGGHVGENEDLRQAVKLLSEFNQEGALDNVPFDSSVEHDQRRREVGGLNGRNMSEFDVVLEHVSKTYAGGARAVIDFNAQIRHGEFVAMLGPSGCGKTTTLRMIGGLEEVTEGKIFISGKDVTDLPPRCAIHR